MQLVFCHHVSQLIQLTRGNILHPERFDQMISIEQGKDSLPKIVLFYQKNP
jgi:hypothetical protein